MLIVFNNCMCVILSVMKIRKIQEKFGMREMSKTRENYVRVCYENKENIREIWMREMSKIRENCGVKMD